jgi:anti-sigma regulatory factor (Ser/Thr protein kinase)
MRREFPVSSAGLSAAFDFVAEAVARWGGPAAVAHRISIIVDEVCANMLRHDDSLTDAQRFSLELMPGGPGRAETVLVISDPGRPFNPLEHRAGRPAEIGGHGLALIRGLSSSVRYERIDGCNRLTVSIPAGE